MLTASITTTLQLWTGAAASAAAPAQAPPDGAEVVREEAAWLRWSAPAACPGATAVESEILALTSDAPSETPDAGDISDTPEASEGLVAAWQSPTRAEGRIEASERGFALEASIETASGRAELSLQDADCQVLATAFALTVAMSNEPEFAATWPGVIAQSEPQAAKPRDAEPPPAPPVIVDEAPPTAVPDETTPTTPMTPTTPATPNRPAASVDSPGADVDARLPLFAALAFDAGTGLLPRADLRLSGGLGFWRGRFEMELRGVWLAPRPLQDIDGQPVGDATGAGAHLRACAHLPFRRGVQNGESIAARGCGFLEGGWVRGRGVEAPGAREVDLGWFGGGVAAGLSFPVARGFELGLELDAQVQPTRPAFSLAGVPDRRVHQAEIFAFRGGLQARYRWGRTSRGRSGRRAELFSPAVDQKARAKTRK